MLNQLRLLRDVSALVLIAATWRLWFAASDFPAVPFFRFLTEVPQSVDPILSGLLVTSLLINVGRTAARVAGRNETKRFVSIGRACDLALVFLVGMLVLLNQHCLQPWMYHFLILTPLLWLPAAQSDADGEPDVADELEHHEHRHRPADDLSGFSERSVIWLTASIYAWSAWSKLDASFLDSHGPKFVHAICEAFGVSTRFWADRTWTIAAVILPAGELLVAVALLFRRFRTAGLIASLAMHLLLMVAVGPWGLNHEAGVLIWNGYFIAQNVILFLAERRMSATSGLPNSESVLCSATAGQARGCIGQRIAFFVLSGAVLLPAFRSVGGCDTWPAWAVYASSPARVLVQVQNDSVEWLPNELQEFVESRQVNDGWSWLRIDRWSLTATGAPIYPEDRFQLGVARSVAQGFDLQTGIRVIHEDEADRWSGGRAIIKLQGRTEFNGLVTTFLFNTKPR